MTDDIMKLLIMGPQGCGKGTQAKLISEKYGIVHVSTGDLFRANIRQKTELGKIADAIMKKGDLVPDDITNKMVKERLQQPDCKYGFILDGYPRNFDQWTYLWSYTGLDAVLEVDLPEKASLHRLGTRRECEGCGANYNIIYKKPKEEGICDKCQGKLKIRDDDKPEAIKVRLGIYHKNTAPLKQEADKKGILYVINGDQPIPDVTKDIMEALKKVEEQKA
jgi:adenylate kinase